ncbi:MAG: hypothetical protein IJW45_00340 [Oscillospiraceae bacterium]|nr:hypothetical protein [Oscillospiraceae bacterium]
MNLDNCDAECKKVEKYIMDGHLEPLENYDAVKEKIIRTEYGSGGELLHRGFYCPSIVADIICGNIKRGRISHSVRSKNCVSFIYGFDDHNRLITVERPFSKEFIVYEDAVEIGIGFSKEGRLETLSQCEYSANGQITSYKFFLLSPGEKRVIEFREERYTYHMDKVIVDQYCYSGLIMTGHRLQHQKFIFTVTEGHLTSYTVEEYHNGEKIPRILDGHVFKVYVKRKI